MKKIAVRFLILTGLLKMTLGLRDTITYVDEKKTWSEARDHCREYYTDLYSGYNKKDEVELTYEIRPNDGAWIGLYREANNTWKWSEGNNASVFNWSQHHYDDDEKAACVAQTLNGWRKMHCHKKLHFLCFQTHMVLVKENKTWEEALEHCHTEHKDIATAATEGSLTTALRICRDSQTEYVWIGMRYLAGHWLTRKSQGPKTKGMKAMPECPAWGHNCGAIATTEQTWVNWDCAAKLNFICY